jgi:hypothetical protein
MDDLKADRLLKDLMAKARDSKDPKTLAALRDADAYLQKIAAVWNGDHNREILLDNVKSVPYLGLAGDWGYDRFYDDWREQMLRFAAALKGVAWVE